VSRFMMIRTNPEKLTTLPPFTFRVVMQDVLTNIVEETNLKYFILVALIPRIFKKLAIVYGTRDPDSAHDHTGI
jgi:hypothetical protein